MPTTEAFWRQIEAYNEATWPVQVVMVIVAATLTYFVFAKSSASINNLLKGFLSFAFAWNGIVFFVIFAKSPMSTFFSAPLFVIVAILFTVDLFAKKTQFGLPKAKWSKYLTIFWVLLALLYPLIGWALGHAYPQTCTPVMPCPITVFALALLAAAIPKVDKKVYILALPWALMALPKCLGTLDCYEDCVLFGAGVYALVMLVKSWKAIGENQREEDSM